MFGISVGVRYFLNSCAEIVRRARRIDKEYRAVMRLGWEIPNPINAFNASDANAFPFSVYLPYGSNP